MSSYPRDFYEALPPDEMGRGMNALPRTRSRAARDAAVLVVILLATVAAYARALRGEFVFDDVQGVVTRVETKDLAGYAATGLAPGFERGGAARPLTDLTFALNYAISGFGTFSYHALNLAVHLAAILLVFAFTRETLRRAAWSEASGTALAVAALFALHPLESQAVSYVSQRSESIASALYLAALLLLLSAEDRLRTIRGAALYGLATLAFVAGLGTKVIVVTAPVAYVAHHVWFPAPGAEGSRRRELARAAARVLPWFALAAVSAAVTFRGLEGHSDAGFGVASLTPWTYLLTQARVLLRYLALIAFPVGQNLDPDVRISTTLADIPTLASVLAVAGLLAGSALLLRSAARARDPDGAAARRVGSFGIAWFFLLLAPTSSIVPLLDVMVEHRVYLAAWGAYAAAAVAAEVVIRRAFAAGRARTIATAVACCACAALWAALHARNAVWESSVALWSDVVSKSPLKERGWSNLGHAYLTHGDPATAAGVLEHALALDPFDATAQHTVAILLLDQGRLDEAEVRARQAIALAPDQGAPYNTLGEIALRRDDAEGALALFRESVARGGGVPARLFNVASTLEALGRLGEACEAWGRYLRVEGNVGAREQTRARVVARGCVVP